MPLGEEQKRQSILADNTQPSKPSIVSPTNGASLSGTVDIKFNASDKYLSAVLLLINNTLKADGPWIWQRNGQVEAQGSYKWETDSIPAGSYEIKLLAFDEHGANNGPSISTITVNVAVPSNPTTPIFPSLPPKGSIPKPSPSTPPNNEPVVPPVTPPPDNAPKKPQTSSGLSLPMEYGYGIAVSLAFIAATIAGYLYSKRKK